MEKLFKIYKVDKIEAQKIQNESNNPHQHDFEELIVGLKGKLTHFIDYKTQTISSPFISFVTKGKIHIAQPEIEDNDCDFWVLRFRSEFIPEITFQLYNFYHDQANFTLSDPTHIHRIDTICQLISDEYLTKSPELAIIRELLSVLFIMIESERRKVYQHANPITNNHNTTFRNFLAILEDNFRRTEGVNFYAEKLFMSTKSLNTITQNILHLPVSEIIETRKLIEAKKLLFTTDKTIAEIGYELGYADKAYFTTVFKKKSGQTPSEFREEMKNLLS